MPEILNYLLESVNHVTLPREVTKECVKEFEALSKSWTELNVQLHVLDFQEVARLHVSFYPPAIQFRKKVEEKGKSKMISINVAPNILDQMRAAGVVSALGYMKNTQQITRKAKSEDTAEEARDWIGKYLIEASSRALTTMFNTTVIVDEFYKESIRNLHPERFSQVAMVISAGPTARLSVRLYFETGVITNLSKRVLPDQTEMDKETLDSMATELLNITYNSAKSKLNDERGYQMPVGMPSIITSVQAMSERFGHWRDARVLPMVTPLGTYYLEIEYHF